MKALFNLAISGDILNIGSLKYVVTTYFKLKKKKKSGNYL